MCPWYSAIGRLDYKADIERWHLISSGCHRRSVPRQDSQELTDLQSPRSSRSMARDLSSNSQWTMNMYSESNLVDLFRTGRSDSVNEQAML